MRRYSNPDFARNLTRVLDSPSGQLPRRSKRRQIQRQLDQEDVGRLVEAYAAGTPLADLARTFGIHRSTVSAHVKRRGVDLRCGLIERNIEEATRLYNEGRSVPAVGQHFGVHGSTVLRVLKAAGVAIRPSKRYR
jgi:transposase-like protein